MFKFVGESGVGEGLADVSATPRTPWAKVPNRSASWNGTLPVSWRNANNSKMEAPRFGTIQVFPPAVERGDLYLPAFWSAQGNLSEASHLADSEGQAQRGIFLYLTPECKQWLSAEQRALFREVSSSKNSAKVNTGNLWVCGEHMSLHQAAFRWLGQGTGGTGRPLTRFGLLSEHGKTIIW